LSVTVPSMCGASFCLTDLESTPVRPLALVREHGRTVLLLEDPGGEPLDRLLATYGGRKVLTLRHPPAPSDTDKFIWWTQQSGCKG